jgi:hypothetical protein
MHAILCLSRHMNGRVLTGIITNFLDWAIQLIESIKRNTFFNHVTICIVQIIYICDIFQINLFYKMRTFFLLVSAIAIVSQAQGYSDFIPRARELGPESRFPCQASSRAFLEMSGALESIMGKFVQTSEYLHDHPGFKPKYHLHMKKFMKSAFKLKKDFNKMAKNCGRRFRTLTRQDTGNGLPVNSPIQRATPMRPMPMTRNTFNGYRFPMTQRRIPESFWERMDDSPF